MPPSGRSVMLELEKADVHGGGAEADLAIGQIILPHAPETVVESEFLDARPGVQESVAPFAQCPGIAVAEHLVMHKLEAGARRFPRNDRRGRQHAAGKDVTLDEVRTLAV